MYFGRGAYGVQAAALRYFSVNAVDLTLPQAAMLAGLVQTPTDDDPIDDPARALARRDQVLHRMLALGHITDADLAAIPPSRSPSRRPRRRRTAASTLSGAASSATTWSGT